MTIGNNYSTPEPRVFLFDDARHAAGYYQFEGPLNQKDLCFNVDQLVGSGVDTLIYCCGTEGGVVIYDSKVAPKWGKNVKRWTHPVWYRAGRNLMSLIEAGHDPLQLLCEHANRKGLWFIAGNWVNFQGASRQTDGGLGRKSDFVFDHPEFQVGLEDDPRSEFVDQKRFSFLHAAVREERFAQFAEQLTRYTTDGIELDLIRFSPFCRFDEVEKLAPLMTVWIRQMRAVADQAEGEQDRRKRIYVRIPAQPPAWQELGYDVPTWVAEGLVDGLVCATGYADGAIDTNVDLTAAVELTRGTDCRVLSACSSLLFGQLEKWATAPMLWGAAANAYAQGADGFGLCVAHWNPKGWPWLDREYETLRPLGHPDLLEYADKLYRARSDSSREPTTLWLAGDRLDLPQTLQVGQPVRIGLRISDDLRSYENLGRLEKARLRVRISSIEPELSEARFKLNGTELHPSHGQLNDLGYRQIASSHVGPYGYVYEFDLSADSLPTAGVNWVEVNLEHKDSNIALDFDVVSLDLVVSYKQHRNFRRQPIDY